MNSAASNSRMPFIKNPALQYIVKAVLFCVLFTLLFIGLSLLKSFTLPYKGQLSHAITGTVAAAITIAGFLWFDKRSPASILLAPEAATAAKFCIGVLAGTLLMGSLLICSVYLSGLKITLNQSGQLSTLLVNSLPLIPLAWMEELGFRTYPLVLLKEKNGTRTVILITAILFAIYHIANGWTVTAAMSTGIWGIVFASAAIHYNGIAMPTGLHYAANLVPSAFGTSSTAANLFILQQANGQPMENYQENIWVQFSVHAALLAFAVWYMQFTIKKSSRR